MTGGPGPFEPCTCSPAHRRAALFTAAVLCTHGKLDHETRSRVISTIGEFDIHDPQGRLKGLSEALVSAGTAIRRSPGARSFRCAAIRAEEWLRHGVHSVVCTVPAGPNKTKPQESRVLFAKGNRSILNVPAVAVLNSRTPRRVSPRDKWIIASRRLVEYALENRMAVVSSYGNLAYSMVSYLAKGSPLIIVCDRVLPFMASERDRTRFAHNYGDLFHSESTLFISSFSPGPPASRAARCIERDTIVAELAQTLLVASIRPGGNMEAILTTARKRNVNILGADISSKPGLSIGQISSVPVPTGAGSEDHEASRDTVHASPEETIHLTNNRAESNLDTHTRKQGGLLSARRTEAMERCVLTSLNKVNGRRYLVHYTRSCPGPWPGQTIAEYCRSLVECHGDAAHTGFDTLNRILLEGFIRGSSRMIRGTTPVVSFTEHLPPDVLQLIEWRKGLARWSFEPYGIAVEKEVLLRLGVGQVIYGDERVYDSLPTDKRYLFQLVKSAGKEWSEEREWRLLGNLHLKDVGHEGIVVVVRTMQEATAIEDGFALNVIAADRLRGKDTDVNDQ